MSSQTFPIFDLGAFEMVSAADKQRRCIVVDEGGLQHRQSPAFFQQPNWLPKPPACRPASRQAKARNMRPSSPAPL